MPSYLYTQVTICIIKIPLMFSLHHQFGQSYAALFRYVKSYESRDTNDEWCKDGCVSYWRRRGIITEIVIAEVLKGDLHYWHVT